MFRIDDPTAVASLPAPEAAGTEGYFTEGNPGASIPATRVRGSWLNMIQEEIRAVIVSAGLTPSKTVFNQLLTAIQTLIAGKAIGLGQTWQDLTASRALSTTYTNSTGRAIMVSVAAIGTGNGTMQITLDGGLITYGTSTLNSGQISAVTALIPAGGTYRASFSGSTFSIASGGWLELR